MVDKRLILSCGIILLFLFSSVVPISIGFETKQSDNKEQPSNHDNTLYVGGTGPENYTKIQDAIDNSSDGDTVFVYDDSAPYLEPLLIDKSIKLVGEDRNSTIIDGNQDGTYGCNIEISAYSVVISDFTLINKKGFYDFSILKIHSNENQIINNIFNSTLYCRGIYLFNGENNLITKNIFQGIYNYAIIVEQSNNSIITENRFEGEDSGIALLDSNNNIVSANELVGTYYVGIYIQGKNNTVSENIICHAGDETLAAGIKVYGKYKFDNNTFLKNRIEYCENGILTRGFSSNIKENIISKCKYGIWLWDSYYNIILKNNISENEEGIHITNGNYNIVTYNNLTSNSVIGIMLWAGYENEILKNNICWNEKNAKNFYCKRVTWDGNYWGKTMIFPKIFLGEGRIYLYTTVNPHGDYENVYFYYLKIDIDWHPAKEPYDI